MPETVAKVMRMLVSVSTNLDGQLAEAEALLRDARAGVEARPRQAPVERAESLARSAVAALGAEAAYRLRVAAGSLLHPISLAALLPAALDGAIALVRADYGNIQLLDPATGTLRIVTQAGFGGDFLETFALVTHADASACGRALRHRRQIAIRDIETDRDFAPYREIAAAAGYRAVLSTPLFDQTGQIVGLVSTHRRDPWSPSPEELMLARLYADLAGEAIVRKIDHGDAQPVPGHETVISLVALDGGAGRVQEPSASASRPHVVSDLATLAVSELFDIALKVDSARSAVGDGPGGQRLLAASKQIETLIVEIRHFVSRRG